MFPDTGEDTGAEKSGIQTIETTEYVKKSDGDGLNLEDDIEENGIL
mgnify:CR=1 FL=1